VRRHLASSAAVAVALAIVVVAVGPVRAAQRAPIIAAAANVNFALTEIADRFARDGGERVQLVFGSSGALTRQIQDGAPFELFLSADEALPDKLVDAGLTRDRGVVYAIGRLVVFAPNGSPLTVDERLDGLARLLKAGGVDRFAIANPEIAPYGKAAEATLRTRGLWDKMRSRLVLADTIAQAAQFATTGNAVGGLIAYSTALEPGLAARGKYALISSDDHAPLRQRMVVLKRAGARAQQFYTYLQGDIARATFEKFGYEVPR
jgi:molybdate transport system substrate-binding protein